MNCSANVIVDSISPTFIRLTTLLITFPCSLFEDIVRSREISYTSHHQYDRNIRYLPTTTRTLLVTSTHWRTVIDRMAASDNSLLRQLSVAINNVLQNSRPSRLEMGEWHLPFINARDIEYALYHVFADKDKLSFKLDMLTDRGIRLLQMASVARCLTLNRESGTHTLASFNRDLDLFSALSQHDDIKIEEAAEHLATPDRCTETVWFNGHLHANLIGWCQYRQVYVREQPPMSAGLGE